MRTTLYLDVDGVLNAVTGGKTPETGTGGWDDWRTDVVDEIPISYSPSMLRRLEALDIHKNVEIRWLTAWEERAPEILCPMLNLLGERWPVVEFASSKSTTWWKLKALDLDYDGNRVIWVDDELKWYGTALDWMKSRGSGNYLTLSPDEEVGLTLEDIEKIEGFVG